MLVDCSFDQRATVKVSGCQRNRSECDPCEDNDRRCSTITSLTAASSLLVQSSSVVYQSREGDRERDRERQRERKRERERQRERERERERERGRERARARERARERENQGEVQGETETEGPGVV